LTALDKIVCCSGESALDISEEA